MHTHKGDNTGKLLNISLRYTQLQLGIATPFFKVDYDDYSYLCDKTWLTHLWEYTSSRGLTIDLTDPGLIPIQRQNDKFLMDILHKSSSISPHECIIANKVRLALQILHLSDIVDGTGRKLLPDVRNGTLHRSSTLNWPRKSYSLNGCLYDIKHAVYCNGMCLETVLVSVIYPIKNGIGKQILHVSIFQMETVYTRGHQ